MMTCISPNVTPMAILEKSNQPFLTSFVLTEESGN